MLCERGRNSAAYWVRTWFRWRKEVCAPDFRGEARAMAEALDRACALETGNGNLPLPFAPAGAEVAHDAANRNLRERGSGLAPLDACSTTLATVVGGARVP